MTMNELIKFDCHYTVSNSSTTICEKEDTPYNYIYSKKKKIIFDVMSFLK